MKQEKAVKIRTYIAMHIVLLVYSLGNVFSKFASKEQFMSLRFIMFYGGVLAVLAIYAVVWQQVLKHIPLTTAFCNKAIGIIWGIVWGCLIFKEALTWNMILGAVIVIAGVIIVVKADD